MTETNEKKILIDLGNVRIKEYDKRNIVIEKIERVFIPTTKEQKDSWQFKGYSSTILSALETIVKNEWLIDQKTVSSLYSFLGIIQNENKKVLKVLEELKEAKQS